MRKNITLQTFLKQLNEFLVHRLTFELGTKQPTEQADSTFYDEIS